MINNFNEITAYYNYLIQKTKNHEYVDIINEWLIDNYYVIVEQKNNLLLNQKDLKKYSKIINKNYKLLESISAKKMYNIDFKYLVDELKKYQKETQDFFSYKEIELIIPTFMFIYMDRLNKLCHEEYKKLLNRDKIVDIIKNENNLKLESFIQNDFDIETINVLTDEDAQSAVLVIAPIMEAIHNNIEENMRLTKLRDALLPKLMSGELDVSRLVI